MSQTARTSKRSEVETRAMWNAETLATEQLARSILDQTAEAIVVCDPESRIILASQSAHRLAGQNPVGQPFQEIFPLRLGRSPRPWHRLERRKQPRLKPEVSSTDFCGDKTVRGVQVHLLRDDGECYDLLMSAGPFLNSKKQATGCIMSFLDVTHRTTLEDALQESESRFNRLADSNIIGIVSADDTTILEANDAFLRIVGYTRDDLSAGGIRWREMTPPEYHGLSDRQLQELLSSGNSTAYEKEYIRKDGTRVPVLIGAVLVEATPFRWVGFVVDLAERKSAETELREAKQNLERRVQERTAQLAEMNHALAAEIVERKKTERALRTSRAEFEAFVDSAPDAIVSVNREGRIVLVNSQTEKVFGYARDELLGKPVELLLPQRYRNLHARHRSDYIASPTTRPMGVGLELSGRRKDGTDFPVEISLSPVQTQGDVLVTSIVRDVTERKRVEAALARQTLRLQEQANLIELAHDAILMRDMDGRITFWNHGAQETYGWPAEKAIGHITHSFLQAEFPMRMDQVQAKLLEEGQWEGEVEHTTRDGTRIVIASRQVLQRDEHHQPRAILEINRDITQRKRAEEKLSESEARFRTLVEQVQDYAIFGVDPEGRVTSWNAGAERVYGYASAEIVGHSIARFYSSGEAASDKLKRELEIAAAEGVYEEVGPRVRKDGSRYWADVLVSALRDPNGDLRGFANVTRDITERKKSEEEIQKLNQELEHRVSELATVNQELEAFSYSVSHDLRAPLRGIAGFSQALVEDYNDVLDDQGKDYTRRIHSATQRLTQLIDDLLTLSRVTRSEMNREMSVDVSSIVTSIGAQLRATNPNRQVEFVVAPRLITRGDPRLLRIALENLVGNAYKFTSKVPEARVEFGSAGKENGKTIYFVRDNGAGFDTTYADKLFGPFQRLHSANEFPGTGIGLATVQRIIRRHGGRVWAESAVGQGATFYFTL